MSSRFEHLSLSKNKFACNRYFTSTSTENDSSSFFSTSALKCTSEVNKGH